jgi:hypothetical protein
MSQKVIDPVEQGPAKVPMTSRFAVPREPWQRPALRCMRASDASLANNSTNDGYNGFS